MKAPALELRGIDKAFGSVRALRGVDLTVQSGSVHALVGENGAGKSTLMKIAYGHARADAGTLRIAGIEVERSRHSAAGAIARNLGMVHQHFMLVPTLTVAENLILGREPTRGGLLARARALREIEALAQRVGMPVEPRALVRDLTVGEKQWVEILRVLYHGAELLILDEPTAVLGPQEVRELFAVLRRLVETGTSCVIVTHKLDEVTAIADRVTVMRRGQVAAELSGDEIDAETIARAMVGRPVLLSSERSPSSPRQVVLSVQGLSARGPGGRAGVADASLTVRSGEILGLCGVQGNGQSELFEAIAGLRPSTGRVLIGELEITRASVRQRGRAGLGHVPEDRHERGLVLDFSVADNLMLGQEDALSRFGVLQRTRIDARARERIAEFDVRPAEPQVAARTLSGGNQQKLVIARELARDGLRALLCAQPTRGVDIGAVEIIHRQILEARDRGVAVLLLSSELSELRALADRILVFYRGAIVAELPGDVLASEAGTDEVGELMTGARAAQERAR